MHQENDYMDELFNRAAGHYPLNTRTSDWEKFQAELDKVLPPVGSPENRVATLWNRTTRIAVAAVFVLLPLVIAVTDFSHGHKDDLYQAMSVKAVQGIAAANVNGPVSQSGGAFFVIPARVNTGNNFSLTGIKEQKHTDNFQLALNDHDLSAVAKHHQFSQQQFLNKHALVDVSLDQQPAAEQPGSEQMPKETPAAKTGASRGIASKFYLGALIAPEYTRVKYQAFSKPGINFGMLAGYKINNKFSVELGVLLARKYYYTSGKYLQGNTLNRDGSQIISVEAYNSITEIPLTLKYSFWQKPESNFFASAGIVSYVMHKELYNYSYDANGQTKEGVKYINKSSNYYCSSVQLSGGYEHQILKGASLRIEPYYRVPVSGIGVSNLPVTSIGLNIAVTADLK